MATSTSNFSPRPPFAPKNNSPDMHFGNISSPISPLVAVQYDEKANLGCVAKLKWHRIASTQNQELHLYPSMNISSQFLPDNVGVNPTTPAPDTLSTVPSLYSIVQWRDISVGYSIVQISGIYSITNS